MPASVAAFEALARREGHPRGAIASAAAHLRRWAAIAGMAEPRDAGVAGTAATAAAAPGAS
jgi:hypothetical protein